MSVLADHLLVVSGLATSTYLCCSPLPDNEGYFVCLLVVAFSTCYNVCDLSLSLMACTWWFQLIIASFVWHVIPARHFPQKSLLLLLKIGPCWIMGLPSLGLSCVHSMALLAFSSRTTLLFLL